MADTVVKKSEMLKKRVDGDGVPPPLTRVVGAGSEMQQGWKIGTERNWLDAPRLNRGNFYATQKKNQRYLKPD